MDPDESISDHSDLIYQSDRIRISLEMPKEEARTVRHQKDSAVKRKRKSHRQEDSEPSNREESHSNTKSKKIRSSQFPKESVISRGEVQRLAADCQNKGLNRDETAVVVKKWKRREHRRLKRQKDRERKKVCFNCRKPGHQLADCPEVLGTREFAVGVCFKCGSTEHTVAQCRLKIKNFPYAKCFVCGETGHLSRNCEENPNGAFPEGGSCKECGATDHLRKDCPMLVSEKSNTKGKVQISLKRSHEMASADDDSFAYIEEEPTVSLATKRQPKVVRF